MQQSAFLSEKQKRPYFLSEVGATCAVPPYIILKLTSVTCIDAFIYYVRRWSSQVISISGMFRLAPYAGSLCHGPRNALSRSSLFRCLSRRRRQKLLLSSLKLPGERASLPCRLAPIAGSLKVLRNAFPVTSYSFFRCETYYTMLLMNVNSFL